MSQLVAMAKELLIIDADLNGRLDYIIVRQHTKNLHGNIRNYYTPYIFEQPLNDETGEYQMRHSDDGERKVDDTYAFPLMTRRVYVFVPKSDLEDEMCFVFFGSKFAYAAPYSEEFMNDVKAHNVANTEDATQRYLADAKWYRTEKG